MSLPELAPPPASPGAGPFSNMDFMKAPTAPSPFPFMRPSSAPPMGIDVTTAAKLDMTDHYMLFGDQANRKVFYQNRRLFLGNGRMLQQAELADEDQCGFAPRELRAAVAEDMMKPPAPPSLPVKDLLAQDLTPEERLRAMDLFVSGPVVRYNDYQAKGIRIRTPVGG